MSRLDTLDNLKYRMPSWDFSAFISRPFKVHNQKHNHAAIWTAAYVYYQKELPCLDLPS